jgi:hypothetical protein
MGEKHLNLESRPLKNFLKGLSILLAILSVVLLEIFIGEYGLYEKLDWSYLSAAILNLSVSLLLHTSG